jgi:hypothetical protein
MTTTRAVNAVKGCQGFQETQRTEPSTSFAESVNALEQAAHGSDADAVWAGLHQFAEAYRAVAEAGAKRRKADALAKRRARYAARREAGIVPVRRLKPDYYERERDVEHRCACGDPGASPPCFHCTDCDDCA